VNAATHAIERLDAMVGWECLGAVRDLDVVVVAVTVINANAGGR